MLKPGQAAPDFSLPDQDGKLVSGADFKGKKYALYFYPKDNTPTCTEQACSLRDGYDSLRQKGILLMGVSTDSERRHQNFIRKFSLPFPLLVDTEHKLADAFGVWGEKTLFGRKYMGMHRVTFLIDEAGRIAQVIDRVDAKNHAAQILQAWAL
ncbi:MAG: thioredoxin-dependent thiol peroxidase [Bacteroidetes bacterium]|nr:thioredoxin-dependent thiol peroxidase [Bacteroidota bacterium]